MARTRRKYQDWVEWTDGFEDRLHRGLVDIPAIESLSDGSQGVDEIWGRNKKRSRRKVIKKARRRRDKVEIYLENPCNYS